MMSTRFRHVVIVVCALGLMLASTHSLRAQETNQSPSTDETASAPNSSAVQSHPWLRLTINLPAKELRVLENNQVVARYKVAIGQPRYPSPVLSHDINRIIWNPSWIPPNSPWAAGASVTPPGPNNPLGPVKMPITEGILIHGTNKPNSVGQAASHGCFRMHSEEAAHLAWYLQERASLKTDPSLWDQYRKFRSRTVWVNLTQSIPVDVVYHAAEVDGDQLTLYPDVYRKVHNWQYEIRSVLAAHGLNANSLQDESIQRLVKQLHKGPTSIPLHDLLDNRVASAAVE